MIQVSEKQFDGSASIPRLGLPAVATRAAAGNDYSADKIIVRRNFFRRAGFGHGSGRCGAFCGRIPRGSGAPWGTRSDGEFAAK